MSLSLIQSLISSMVYRLNLEMIDDLIVTVVKVSRCCLSYVLCKLYVLFIQMYTVYLLTRISGSEISYLSISTATLLPFCRVILEYGIHFATV